MTGTRSSLIPWAAIDAIAETGDLLIARPKRTIPIAIPKRAIPDLNELWLTIDAGRANKAAILMRIQKCDAPIVIPKRAIPDITVFRTLVDDRIRDRNPLIKKLQRTLKIRA